MIEQSQQWLKLPLPDTPDVFQNNVIKTSKYTVITFLPLNLLEQFQRLANFYFLCLLVLQTVRVISSLTPITTALPLIGVLSLTAIKDAYDDFVSVRVFWYKLWVRITIRRQPKPTMTETSIN